MSKMRWATGVVMVACTGAVVAYGFTGQAGATTTATGTTAVQDAKAAASSASSRAGATVLSGKRQVTIVRTQASESGLSLTADGRLAEVDDDSGRQLFVPTPLGKGKYLIKAYDTPNGHPAADEPSCWQVRNLDNGQPLTVEAAACDAGNPDQRFTITTQGKRTYSIANGSAFLQHSPTRGLILEELGDAPLSDTFRLVDNGPAPTVAD